MAHTTIERNPTQEDKTYVDEDGFKVDEFINSKKKKKTEKERFEQRLNEELLKANKDLKDGFPQPFAERAARDDFYGGYKRQAEKIIKEKGYIDAGDIKPININWKNYSNLKNFELLAEGEQPDSDLTKHNPGLYVQIGWKKYKFKGYSNTYKVMESPHHAIQRAKKNLKELE